MKSFTAGKNDEGLRLDRFVSKAAPLLPPSLLQKYIRIKRIKVNGKRAEKDYRLVSGDVIEMYINDEFFPEKDGAAGRTGTEKTAGTALNIVYEDDNIMIINKPAGLAAHPFDGAKEGETLVDYVKTYLLKKGDWNPEKENTFVPALCNRIDRNTSGLVIAAKNAPALRIMNEKIKNREVTKKYLLIVHGTLEKKEGAVEGYISKDEKHNKVSLVSATACNSSKPSQGRSGQTSTPEASEKNSGRTTEYNNLKYSKTLYRVIKEKDTPSGWMSLVECELLTGRSHQIRVMMASIDHPLYGDHKYGKPDSGKSQALCSYKIIFSFKTDAGCLGYLSGREFSITPDFSL